MQMNSTENSHNTKNMGKICVIPHENVQIFYNF